nr:hypothetical protein CFP56_62751 [Quercus suber]
MDSNALRVNRFNTIGEANHVGIRAVCGIAVVAICLRRVLDSGQPDCRMCWAARAKVSHNLAIAMALVYTANISSSPCDHHRSEQGHDS